MANYGIKLDLLKVKGAGLVNIKGKTATKKCLIIPIEESGLFLGEKGCYISLTAVEMQNPQYGDTHCIKVSYDKQTYDKMSDDERRAIPILGGLRAIERKVEQMEVKATETAIPFGDNEMPF